MSKRPIVVYKRRRHKVTMQQAMAAISAEKSDRSRQIAPPPVLSRTSSPRIERPFCQAMASSVFRPYRGWLASR